MGHSQAEKAASRKRIVDIAAKRFRERGFDGIGLAEVMKEAGLTVGAFYRHFASRDELVTEALTATFESIDDWGGKAACIDDAIRKYLTESHRDALDCSCPLTSLVGDVARSDDATRAVFTDRVKLSLREIEGMLDTNNAQEQEAQAMLQLCACVGALSLARAVSDPALSHQLLEKVSAQLLMVAPKKKKRAA